MLSGIISIGDKLNLRKITNSEYEAKKSRQFVSQLLEYSQENEAVIAMPIIGGRVIPLEIGDNYELIFYTSKGLYQCNAVITNRYKEKNIYMLSVRFTSDFEKYQRRQYYRLECNMDIKYQIETEREFDCLNKIEKDQFETQEEKEKCLKELKEIQNTWIPGMLNDISGGGLRCSSMVPCQKEDRMRIKLSMIDKNVTEEFVLRSIVISSIKIPNKLGFYEHRVKFIEINNEQRETIIKFIFQEERRQRRKEKGLD